MPVDDDPPRRGRLVVKVLMRVGAGLLVVALAGASFLFVQDVEESRAKADAATLDARAAGVELAGLRTETAEYDAAIALFELQAANADELMESLATEIAGESVASDKWREVAQGLASCDKARKKVVDALHGKGGSTSTADADKKCSAALSAFKELKAKS